MRKTLTFDAQNSNFFSWFQRRKLTESPWSDLKDTKDILFSLLGYCNIHKHICQNFHIIKNIAEAKCDNIFGWVYRGTFDYCRWERSNLNKVVYCTQQTVCHFQNEGEFRLRGFPMTYYRNLSHKICPGLHAIANIANLLKPAKRKTRKGRKD